MSKSNQQRSVYAVVIDDEGTQYDLTAYYNDGENMFGAIEQEAKERGIRYSDTMMFQFPDQEK